jgi:CRP-like cAMP-binding protein
LTKGLKDSEIQQLVKALEPQSFKKGDIIIKYGEMGIFYYILAKGKAKVTVYKSEADPQDPNLDK